MRGECNEDDFVRYKDEWQGQHRRRHQMKGWLVKSKQGAMNEKMRPSDAGRAGLPMVNLEHPRAFGLSEIPL